MSVNFNPYSTSSDSIAKLNAKVDTTNAQKPKDPNKVEQTIFSSYMSENGTMQIDPQPTTPTPVQNKPKPQPKPAPPKPAEMTATANQQTSVSDYGQKSMVGSFNTNIPGFTSLNFKTTNPVIDANGVGIYVTGDNKSDVNAHIINQGPPTILGINGMNITIPDQGDNTKNTSIVCNSDGTVAFNNIEGLEFNVEQTNNINNILVNGGSVKSLNTAELYKENSDILKDGAKQQNIVLLNTHVENAKLGNDNVLLKGDSTITNSNVISKNAHNSFHTKSFIYGKETSNNYSLQSGLGEEQFFTNAIGANKKEIGALATNDYKHGNVKVQDERFSGVNMSNVSVARTLGNLNIYNSTEDGKRLTVTDNNDGTYKIALALDGSDSAEFIIDKDQPKDAQIFFDSKTHSIYVKNVNGLNFNPRDNRLQVNLFLNNVEVEKLHSVEFNTSTDAQKARSGNGSGRIISRNDALKYQSNFAFTNNTTVTGEAVTYEDNVFVDESSKQSLDANFDGLQTHVYAEEGEIALGSKVTDWNAVKYGSADMYGNKTVNAKSAFARHIYHEAAKPIMQK